MKNISLILLSAVFFLSTDIYGATKKVKNPFQSYHDKIKGLELKLEKAEKENDKRILNKQLEKAQEQLDKSVAKMKDSYQKKLEKYQKSLSKAKNEKKKESINKSIEKLELILQKIDEFAKPPQEVLKDEENNPKEKTK